MPGDVTRMWNGGCQCGAVRYALLTAPEHVSICHCRMCQKASGQPFMAFAQVKAENIRWTRGQPGLFKSSNIAERGFCKECGTPLIYRYVGGSISVTLCSLDHPEMALPEMQYGCESKLPWTSALERLPGKTTADWLRDIRIDVIDNHQHPDREKT